MIPILGALILASSSAPAASAAQLPFKQVAAPASDIVSGLVRLPEPSACATTSQAELLPVAFEWNRALGWSFEAPIHVATSGKVALALLSFAPASTRLEVRSARGAFVPVEELFADRGIDHRTQVLEEEMVGWGVDRYDVADWPAGDWTVRITALDSRRGAPPAPGWFIVRESTPIALSAYVTTLATLSGSRIGIQASLHASNADANTASSNGIVRSGEITVDTSRGTQHVALFDDGLHDDGVASDGVFGAFLDPWTSGDVRARVDVHAITSSGNAFVRTVQLAFPVIERRTLISGNVDTVVEDPLRLRIDVGAVPIGPASQLHVSAEVWGTDGSGELVPVCWLSRMAVPEERGGEWKLPLHLDGRWIDVARVHAPFALRNVRVQDPDTHVPYDVVEWLPLPIQALPAVVGSGTTAVSTSMLMSSALSQPTTPTLRELVLPFSSTLMLVHGYCSSGSIWPAADFTQPKVEFLDPNQNRTHDQFAQLILQLAGRRESIGIIGHSQGGPAALHLYTYYLSPLDRAHGARRIQSVASPYQGTPLASLGAFSCGVNNDMTPAGSATWLAGIPSWARAEVWYWTTSDNGSACNFFTGLLLANPEDGTVEQTRGQLVGAHSMGHVVGWCHTTGMTYPANYTDHARNALMNTNAAR